jgi:integrase
MVLFAINTGLRTSDIFNLEWREVDFEQRRLKKIVTKNQRPLSLPLNDTAFRIVEAGRGIQHGPYVFYNPMTGAKFKDVRGVIAAAVKRAGLGRFTCTRSAMLLLCGSLEGRSEAPGGAAHEEW